MLILGAVVGLLGQADAYARAPVTTSTEAAGVSMAPKMAMTGDVDCAKMLSMQNSGSEPCKGLTLACIAKMGCTVPFTVANGAAGLKSGELRVLPALARAEPVLIGLATAPEPFPPSTLN
jgi:hypothetical protein